MKLINNQLFICMPDMVACGFTEANLHKGVSIGYSTLPYTKEGGKLYFDYDNLGDRYREAIVKKFGDPYEYMAKEPIRKMVSKDFKAEEFFYTYRYNGPTGNDSLPIDTIRKYTWESSWLKMLNTCDADKKNHIKAALNLSIEKFFDNVIDLLKIEISNGHLTAKFPTSYQRLLGKMKEYKEHGYPSIIHPAFGNKAAAKIGKTEKGFDETRAEQQMAFIRKAASMHNNFDAAQVTYFVNQVFAKNGWETISESRVKQLLVELKPKTTAGSRGARIHNNTLAMHVKRTTPKHPLYYFTLDGWTVELLYQEAGTFHNRLVMVIVLDACNKYPIGYAIGDRENADLIRMALRNAIVHINELFGKPYRPWQLQSDHYAIKQLTPFYEAISKLSTPAAVGNAKSKIIEPYFMHLNKTYCQTQYNWSGFNITAKTDNQPNREMLDKIKHSLPDKQGAIAQINCFMATERTLKIADYQAKWAAMPAEDKVLMATEDMLLSFGKSTGYTNSITGFGLTPTIGGEKHHFDTFDPAFRQLQHLDWQPYYIEGDLSQILAVSKCGKHKFLLQSKMAVAMSIKETTPEQLDYRSRITQFNKDVKEDIIQTYISDNAIVEQVINNTTLNLDAADEAALKLMFTYAGQQKNAIQDAKKLGTAKRKELRQAVTEETKDAKTREDEYEKFLDNNNDFNQFFNS